MRHILSRLPNTTKNHTGESMALAHDYDKTIDRIVMILGMLHEDKRPTIQELSEEFNVAVRTIQRDIYNRLHHFPIEKTEDGKLKFIDGFQLGYSQLEHYEEFLLLKLALSQFEKTDGTFQAVSKRLLKKMLRSNMEHHFYIKPQEAEPLQLEHPLIKQLHEAIDKNIVITFTYKSKPARVCPYKITSFDGIWYLFAKDTKDEKTRTFTIAKIMNLELTNERFKKPLSIDRVLDGVHSAWFEEGSRYEVEVKVEHNIAHFFTLRKQLSSQQILRTYEDGSLHVRFEISHDEDLDNLIKSWLPHIQVLKPTHFRKRIERELREYLLMIEKQNLVEM